MVDLIVFHSLFVLYCSYTNVWCKVVSFPLEDNKFIYIDQM